MTIDVKPLDYVLIEHPSLSDCLVVQMVTHVTPTTVMVRYLSDSGPWGDDQPPARRRKRGAIWGVFKDRDAAYAAKTKTKAMFLQLGRDQRSLVVKYRADCLALLGGDDGEG